MRNISIIFLLFISILNLTAQSLPADLMAGVEITEKGSTEDLQNTIMNYKSMQMILLEELYNRRVVLSENISQKQLVAEKNKKSGWLSLLAGLAAGGSYALFAVLGNEAYDNYLESTISQDVDDYRDQFQVFDGLSYASMGGSGLALIISLINFSSIPSSDDLNEELYTLTQEIEQLKGEL